MGNINTITLYKSYEKTIGFFSVSVRENTVMSFPGVTMNIGNNGLSSLNNSYLNSISLNANQTYFALFIFPDGLESIELSFGDISRLKTFDATLNYGNFTDFEGIDIDAEDVMKFSYASTLRLRYSVRRLRLLFPDCFMGFHYLSDFSIGCPHQENDGHSLRTIHLPDSVMSQMTHINWLIKEVPSNFHLLTSCRYIYLLSSPHWTGYNNGSFANIQGCCEILSIPFIDSEDQGTVAAFVNRFFVGTNNNLNIGNG